MPSDDASAFDRPVPGGLWTRAVDGDVDSLNQLAGRFWYPVYLWLRVAGNDPADVPVQTVNFFTRVQLSEPPQTGEETVRRFREWTLARLKDFAANGFPAAEGLAPIAMDVMWAERRFTQEPTRGEDDLFNRRWALMQLETTIAVLRGEYEKKGKHELFTTMQPFLGFKSGEDGAYAEAGRTVGLTASAFHVAVYDFRKRYRDVLRSLVSDTVRYEDDLDSELTALLVGAS